MGVLIQRQKKGSILFLNHSSCDNTIKLHIDGSNLKYFKKQRGFQNKMYNAWLPIDVFHNME